MTSHFSSENSNDKNGHKPEISEKLFKVGQKNMSDPVSRNEKKMFWRPLMFSLNIKRLFTLQRKVEKLNLGREKKKNLTQ